MWLTRAVREIRQAEARAEMQKAAFIGFQMGAGGEMNFGEYLQKLGLLEDKSPEPPPPKKTAKELIAWANSLTEKARNKTP